MIIHQEVKADAAGPDGVEVCVNAPWRLQLQVSTLEWNTTGCEHTVGSSYFSYLFQLEPAGSEPFSAPSNWVCC